MKRRTRYCMSRKSWLRFKKLYPSVEKLAMFQVIVAKRGEELVRAEITQAAAQKEFTLATEALKAAKNSIKKTRPDQKEAAKAAQKAAENGG